SLYLFLKRHVSKEAAMSSSLIFSFLTWNPQGFAAWGGSPTILAFALAIVFISFHQAQENLFLTGLFLCSVLLTHPIIFVCLFYLYGVSSLMLKRWRYDAKVVAVAVLLCLPYLVSMENLATPSAVAWARGWVTNTQGNTGFAADIFSVWYLAPRYMFWIIFGRGIENLILLFCIPGYLFLSKKNKESWRYVAMIVGVFFLLLNVNYFILPLSYAIYPERLALFLLLPLSLFFSHFVEALPGKKYFLLLAILLAIFYNPSHFVAIQKGIVTSSDMAVFNYIDKNMPEEAVIENNYGDAGIYIPGILLRKVTVPHINLIYLDKQPSQKSDYIFIGSNCVYSCRLSAEEIGKNHRLVFRDRDSYLFRA
ncbi:MAG: hypothetical protein HGA85_06940, partial [Nanoarchaeota archaeon]|nr:hypothetical protein [Nanoarchaeota archaeon]